MMSVDDDDDGDGDDEMSIDAGDGDSSSNRKCKQQTGRLIRIAHTRAHTHKLACLP